MEVRRLNERSTIISKNGKFTVKFGSEREVFVRLSLYKFRDRRAIKSFLVNAVKLEEMERATAVE